MIAVSDTVRKGKYRLVLRPVCNVNDDLILESDSMVDVRLISGPTLSALHPDHQVSDADSHPLESFYNLFKQDLKNRRSVL